MTTETATYIINVDVKNQEAVDQLNRTAASLNVMGSAADRSAKEIDDVTRSSRSASAAQRGLDSSSSKLGKAITGLAAGFITLELAKKAVQAVTRTLSASFAAFAETNTVASTQITEAKRSLTELQAALGEVIFGGETGNAIFETLNRTMHLFKSFVDENREAIQTLTSVLTTVFEVAMISVLVTIDLVSKAVEYIKLTFESWQNAVTALIASFTGLIALLTGGLLTVMRVVLTAIGNLIGGLASLARATGMDGMATMLDGVAASMDGYAAAMERGAAAAVEFARGQGDVVVQTGRNQLDNTREFLGLNDDPNAAFERPTELRPSTPATPGVSDGEVATAVGRSRGGSRPIRQEVEIVVVESKDSLGALTTSEGAKAAVALQALKARQALLLEAELVSAEAMRVMRLDAAIAEADEIARIFEERMRRISDIAREVGSTAGGFLGAGLDAAFSGKDFGKVALKMIGDYLASKGSAMLTEGAVDIAVGAFGNPAQVARGAAEVAGGTALVATGKGLGGAAKGRGGGRVGAVPTASAAPTQGNVVNNVSFGIVGDRRAAAREVAYVTEQGARLGFAR